MTNFEKITASTEEFSKFLDKIRMSCAYDQNCRNCPLYDGSIAHCGDSFIAWLESEVIE